MQTDIFSRLYSYGIVLWAGFAFLWMALEGNLRWTIFFGVWTTSLLLATLYRRYSVQRLMTPKAHLVLTALGGALLGLGSVVITLFLMAVKTGLHAHGPEFTTAEIVWLVHQTALWTLAGLFAGAGIGLLQYAAQRDAA